MELYFAAHPGAPADLQRPQLMRRGQVWVALLGSNVEEGIAGFGLTVEAALRAFDLRYLEYLHQEASQAKTSNVRAA